MSLLGNSVAWPDPLSSASAIAQPQEHCMIAEAGKGAGHARLARQWSNYPKPFGAGQVAVTCKIICPGLGQTESSKVSDTGAAK